MSEPVGPLTHFAHSRVTQAKENAGHLNIVVCRHTCGGGGGAQAADTSVLDAISVHTQTGPISSRGRRHTWGEVLDLKTQSTDTSVDVSPRSNNEQTPSPPQ